MADQIRYDLLTQQALRGVVRSVLTDAAKKGLPGDHHFYVTFATKAAGVRISERLLAQYPEEMTIILQHQFWDLDVGDTGFEVGLSFGGIPEKLTVPFEAINGFFDPSVQFGLQFEEVTEGEEATAGADAHAGQGGRQKAAHGRPRRVRRRLPRRKRRRPLPPQFRNPRPTNRPAAAKSCGSTVSARSDGKVAQAPRQKPASKATPSARSISPPTNSGARRRSARCTISASAPSACRSRSCARSA